MWQQRDWEIILEFKDLISLVDCKWQDADMDRLVGALEALEFVRRSAFAAPTAAFISR